MPGGSGSHYVHAVRRRTVGLLVLVLGAVSPVIGVTPRLLLRGFPLLGVVGAKLPPLWFEAVLGLSALCMAALGMMAMGGPLWTP